MIVNFKQRHRVLVVDDNRDIRELLGLELQDHQVFFAVDGEEGLAETRRLKPDLVVLDIMMPKLDGFSFLREVERDDGLKFLKVLVLSAKSTKEDLLQGLELGAIDYLTKPFKHDILAAKVDRLLALKYSQEVAAYQRIIWRFLNHHIRNPLNLIGLSGAVTEAVTRYIPEIDASGVEIISEGVANIETLIEQGSFLNHLMTQSPKFGTVNVGNLVVEMGNDLDSRAADAGGREIHFDLPRNEADPFLAVGEEGMVRRALWSILSNAVDHTEAGGRIEVKLHQSGTDVIVTVSDNGRGVPDDQLETLFIRHFPANLQIHGNRIYIAPPRELHSLRSPPMTRLWRADHVRKAIWQRFPPSRHTSPVFSALPSISSAYAGTGLRRRSSIKAKIFWNKIFDTATSASWNVT